MVQPLIPLLVSLLVLVLHASAAYLPPTLADLLRHERIASFMAQKPLPTSALLAGAAMTSFPSPLPVGSHPLEAIPIERVDILQDKVDDLRNEMEEVKAEMKMLKGKAGEAGVKNDDGKEKSNNAGHIVMSNKEKAVTDSDWSYEESR